jgi:minor extracellular serine protease Vpr
MPLRVAIGFLVAFAFIGAAQTLPDRYIVELRGEPAVRAIPAQGAAGTASAVFRARMAQLDRDQQQVRAALEGAGAEVTGATRIATNTLFVRVDESQLDRIRAIPGVLRVHPERLYGPVLDHALPLMHVPEAWNQIGGMSNAGAGMRIAIIDTGIDSSHPAFNAPGVTPPAGFPLAGQDSDRQFTNNKIIVARSYPSTAQPVHDAKDTKGHGTGVAMVAAGLPVRGAFGVIAGVAPGAFLGSYKVFPDDLSGAPTSLIILGLDDAIADGMDVINLSLGSEPAALPKNDVLVTAVENAVAAGVIVTIAAGNSGPNPNTIDSPGAAPDAITVGSMSNDRVFNGALFVDGMYRAPAYPGNGPNSATPITGTAFDVAKLDQTGLACGGLPAGSLAGAIAVILRGSCTFTTKIGNVQQAGAAAALIYTNADNPYAGGFLVDTATLPAVMIDYAVGAALKQQMIGLSRDPIPVGRPNLRPGAKRNITLTLDFNTLPRFVSPHSLSRFSGIGPSSDGGIKPEILSVGGSISTAQPVSAGSYIVESGTSFSAPAVAGAAALLKAARPGLTFQQYRSLLINSSSPLILGMGASAPVQRAGAGFLNMQSVLNGTATATPAAIGFGLQGATLDLTRTVAIQNVSSTSDVFSLSVSPLSGSVAPVLSTADLSLAPGQMQTVDLRLSGSGLAAGSYQGMIEIRSTRRGPIMMIPYWCGVGPGPATYLTVLSPPATGAPGSTQSIKLRTTDSEGIPIAATPVVTVTAGGGSVTTVQSVDSSYPGVYAATVKLGAVAGTNVFHIDVAGLSADVVVVGQ